MADKLIKIVEAYFATLRDVHRLGSGTDERSCYPAVDSLLNGIGADLKGRVLCLSDLGDTGAGHPDFGHGRAGKREHFRLAKDAASFWELVSTPRKSAERIGHAFGEYLKRALTQSVALRAFDPVLRKQLGVWYTPSEVVAYMVARVDKALKEDLGVADGLASDNVYVLDPCCGTGAYVAAVLRRIDRTLADKGYGDLRGQMVKKAALERVLGFEIMPAPFIVAHLQVGSVLQQLEASLTEDHERASVYLTNALTGWEPSPSLCRSPAWRRSARRPRSSNRTRRSW